MIYNHQVTFQVTIHILDCVLALLFLFAFWFCWVVTVLKDAGSYKVERNALGNDRSGN